MIDPENLQLTKNNKNSSITIFNLPTFDYDFNLIYDLANDKEFEKYKKDIEKIVRKSFEYRSFIRYLKDNMNMNKCAYLNNVSNKEDNSIKIEIHHYPFTLYDIIEIVYNKRSHYGESLSVFMVAKEVMELHYKMMIGLIPLSETVHELAHNGKIFIPVDKVMGRYKLFADYYAPFIKPELLDTLKRIEKYTYESNELQDTTILNQNNITYDIKDKEYQLPEYKYISDKMIDQIKAIKENNYLLPVASESIETKNKLNLRSPFIFSN